MADDLEVQNNAGSGVRAVSDEITSPYSGLAGRQAQGVKILDGRADGTDPIPGDAGGLFVQEPKGTKTLSVVAVSSAAATLVLAANANRKSALLLNDAGGTVYFGPDNTVSSTNGLPVTDGQVLNDGGSNDAWYVRAATGVSGNIIVIEVA
jgi:hypothetical protein